VLENNESTTVTQHTIFKSLLHHIIPGLATTIAFVIIKPLLDPTGVPPLMAFLLAVLLVDIPILLGIMLNEGKKLTGKYTLEGVIQYGEKLPWKTFILVFIGSFVVIYGLVMVATPITTLLSGSVFVGLPDWFFLEDQGQYEGFNKSVLVAVFSFQLILTGIVLPWIEELYFRGFLMPRMPQIGVFVPILGGLFFGLYHSWQLYSFVTVAVLGIALSFVVWWKKDLRLSISLHVIANLFSRVMFLLAALAL
jgi:membrane protease YdiL (CAAX protease family)